MPGMALARIEPSQRVGDQAFDAIHDAIMSGEYRAGRRLQIRQLAEELGISVMPVREAIKRLEELGLVETFPYRGAVVKQFTPEELLQLYAVRRLLEVEATRLGAGQVAPEQIPTLWSIHERMTTALANDEVVGYLDLDEELLAEIYEQSGNVVLVDSIRTLWSRCRSYKIVGVRRELDSGNAGALLSYQRELVDAVAASDVERAARITSESLDAATARIRAALPE